MEREMEGGVTEVGGGMTDDGQLLAPYINY